MNRMSSIAHFFSMYGALFKGALRTTAQLTRGIWKVSQLPHPIVTIFGGSRLSLDTRYARQAHELAHLLIRENISVITGGGPGIMEAASCGAWEEIQSKKSKARTLGITVQGLGQREPVNQCVANDYIRTDYFFARKWLMINYSVAFAVFPGGFGTLEELSEIQTLMFTEKLGCAPIILIGADYWQPYLTWLKSYAIPANLVSLQEVEAMRLTDDIHEAVRMLKQSCTDLGLSRTVGSLYGKSEH